MNLTQVRVAACQAQDVILSSPNLHRWSSVSSQCRVRRSRTAVHITVY